MINSFFIKRSPGTPLTEPIEKGDRILSTRDNKSYTVTGFSQEYYIVKETPDSELSAVKRTDAIKLSPAMAWDHINNNERSIKQWLIQW